MSSARWDPRPRRRRRPRPRREPLDEKDERSEEPTAPYTIPDVKPLAGSEIYMLGHDEALKWHMDGNDLVIEEIPNPLPCDHAWSFQIKMAQ